MIIKELIEGDVVSQNLRAQIANLQKQIQAKRAQIATRKSQIANAKVASMAESAQLDPFNHREWLVNLVERVKKSAR